MDAEEARKKSEEARKKLELEQSEYLVDIKNEIELEVSSGKNKLDILKNRLSEIDKKKLESEGYTVADMNINKNVHGSFLPCYTISW